MSLPSVSERQWVVEVQETTQCLLLTIGGGEEDSVETGISVLEKNAVQKG